MTLILTGSPTRYGEDRFTEDNGLLAAVKAALKAKLQAEPEATAGMGAARDRGGRGPRVLLVSAAPDDRGFTDYVLESMTECIRKSGIEPAAVTMLDRRNAGRAAGLVRSAD